MKCRWQHCRKYCFLATPATSKVMSIESLAAMEGISNLSSAQREELIDQVRQRIALANMQELVSKISEKCFKKCIAKPGSVVDKSEQTCVALCMDRYMDSWNLVSQTFSERIQQERHNL